MGQSFCDITVLERAPDGLGETFFLEIHSNFNKEWLDEFHRLIPYKFCHWSEAKKRWYVTGSYFATACELAMRYFRSARVIEGEQICDLKSGVIIEQRNLFS
jgi:hypothetical protein